MKALFVITSDPRTSHRPAEAIRIAAGVAAWKKVQVDVCLMGAAARVLEESVDELVDADHLTRYLPLLRESGGEVFVQNEKDYGPLLEKIFSADSVQVW